MPYYTEEIGFHGRPMPRLYADKPAKVTASGTVRNFHVEPVEINAGDVGRSLSCLRRFYSTDGMFRSVRRPGK